MSKKEGKRTKKIKEEIEAVKKEKDKIFAALAKSGFRNNRTFGQKASDSLTKGAGSWYFILGFLGFIILWMIINVYFWSKYQVGKPFDPYPFILLNLVLSCVAAIQAPIILMSQNRTTQRDRLKAEFDYRINKKAEEEIREIRHLLLSRSKKE